MNIKLIISMILVAFWATSLGAPAWADEVVPDAPAAPNTPPKPKLDDDSRSPIRFWDGSFDTAADATREVEKHNSINQTEENCPTVPANGQFTEEELKKRQACADAKVAVKKMSAEAGGIRKEQRVFADVSRVSDVVAVGSVTAAVGTQLFMKNDSQASSLKKVANIQEVAGYASYTTGATDFGLGAYAYLSQKKRLEDLKKSVGTSISGNPEIQADLENSIEKTKAAAYSHMLYGAGKAAVGFVSMKMAESNRKQIEKLKSITPPPVAPLAGLANGGGPAFTYPTNQATFSVIDPSTGKSMSTTTTGQDTGSGFSSSGTSVMPESRALASKNSKVGDLSASPAAAPGSAASAKPGDPNTIESAEPEAKTDATKDTLSGFEMSLGGGGAPKYTGSNSKTAAEENPLLGIFGGSKEAPKSVATGINPNTLYQDAVSGDQSENGGENDPNTSLFDLIKAKHIKMLRSGRVQRLGEVDIKN